MKKTRPNPSFMEIYLSNDKALHEFMDYYKRSISHVVRTNMSIEDDHNSILLWDSLCYIFHKLKEMQELEEKVFQLMEHLEVDDDEAPVISSHFISCNYLVLGEKEIQIAIAQPQEN